MASNRTYLFVAKEGWSQLLTVKTSIPPARLGHTMAQLNDYTVLMFGGTNKNEGSRYFMGDTWLLEYVVPWRQEQAPAEADGARALFWTKIKRTRYPPGRMGHAMTSMGENKVLMYGGCIGDEYHSGCVTFLNDLWMFVGSVHVSESTWLPISSINSVGKETCGGGPGQRAMHSMAWLSSSVIMFGGQINAIQGSVREPTFAGDTWIMADGCPSGYNGSITGHGCSKCPLGTYSSNHALGACMKCPAGLTTRDTGNDDEDDCNTCVGLDKQGRSPNGTCVPSCNDEVGHAYGCHAEWTCYTNRYGNITNRYGKTCQTYCLNGAASDKKTTTVNSCNCTSFWWAGSTCSVPRGLILIIIFVTIFLVLLVLLWRFWQKTMNVEIHRSEAERSLLQSEIALMNEGRRIDFRDLQWEIKIKTGGQGEVWRGVWLMLPNQYVAIKKMKNFDGGGGGGGNHQTPPSSWETEGGEGEGSNLFAGIEGESKEQEEFRQELKLLMRLKPHERTVLFHGAGRVPGTGELFFVSEFMVCGDLSEALEKRDAQGNPTLSWKARSQIAADIAEGMTFLHSRKPPLIHRDLKSNNVLLRSDGRAKIADFGLSKFTDLQQHAVARRSFVSEDGSVNSTTNTTQWISGGGGGGGGAEMTGQRGTIPWMAPEVDTRKYEDKTSKYGLKIDVYSYAIVLFELITCIHPWEREFGIFMAPIQEAVQAGRRPKLTKVEEEEATSNGAKILVLEMRKCWAQRPKDRPKFREVLRACRQVETVARTYQEDKLGGELRRSTSTSSGTYASPSLHNVNSRSSLIMTTNSSDEGSSLDMIVVEEGVEKTEEVEGEEEEGRKRSYSSFDVDMMRDVDSV